MGKKTHPAAIRIDFTGWKNSVWFCRRSLQKNIVADFNIRESIAKHFSDSMICEVTIERTGDNAIVSLHTHRPSAVLAENQVEKLKEKLKKNHDLDVKFNIVEVFKPEASAQFICDQIVKQLENRGDYKKMAKNLIKFAMKSSSVKGISVIMSGRLGGAAIARTERLRQGSVSMQTFRDKIVYVKKPAQTIYGICGVKVFVSYHQFTNFGNDKFPRNERDDRNGPRNSDPRNFRDRNTTGPTGPRGNYRSNFGPNSRPSFGPNARPGFEPRAPRTDAEKPAVEGGKDVNAA